MKSSLTLEQRVFMLARAADLDLVEGARLFSKAEKPAARALAQLLRDFNYLASVEFDAACAGKSEAFRHSYARRMSSAKAKARQLQEFHAAVENIRDSDRVLALLPSSAEATVRSIRHVLSLAAGQGGTPQRT